MSVSYWFKRVVLVASTATALLLVAPRASAQDAGDLGLTVGSDGAVGLIWHATNAVAVQTAIQFRSTSLENEGILGTNIDESTHALLLEIAVPFYFRGWDRLRAFVAPRYAHTFQSDADSPTALITDRGNHQVAGVFGLQYAISDRFSVTGTTGLAWSHTSSEYTASITGSLLKSTTDTFGTTSRLGIVFYF